MRRSVVLVIAVVGLLLATATPVSSAAAEKTVYYGIECFEVNLWGESYHEGGNTIHVRGGVGVADEYVWDGEDWAFAGTNNTVINANENLKSGTSTSWGTFSISLSGIGDFEGNWANDVARGKATDGSGMLMKTDLAPDMSDFPTLPPFDFCGDVVIDPPVFSLPPSPVMFTIINPHA